MTQALNRRVAKMETGMPVADLSRMVPDMDITKLTARQRARLGAICSAYERAFSLCEISTRDLTDYLAIGLIVQGGNSAEIGNAVFNQEREFTMDEVLAIAKPGDCNEAA